MDQLKTDLIGKSLSGNASPREEEELKAWVNADPRHAETYASLEKTWNLTAKEALPPFTSGIPQAWDRLAAKIKAQDGTPAPAVSSSLARPRSIWSNPYRPILQLAAVLLIGIGLWAVVARTMRTSTQEWSTGADERLSLELPDGSQVWLNQRSTLRYREVARERQVTLNGEAFFAVVKKPRVPFKVLTADLVTTVVGTRFNVRAYPGEQQVKVSVEEGQVALSLAQVAATQQQPIQLRPGKTGTYTVASQRLDTLSSAVANIGAWKTQRLVFVAMPLAEVAITLSEYYGTAIRLNNPAMAGCRFEAQFEGQPLEAVFEVLKAAFPSLTITRQDQTYLLDGAGCQ